MTWKDWQYTGTSCSQRCAAEVVCSFASHTWMTFSQSSALWQLVNWLLSWSTIAVQNRTQWQMSVNLYPQMLTHTMPTWQLIPIPTHIHEQNIKLRDSNRVRINDRSWSGSELGLLLGLRLQVSLNINPININP